MSSQPFLRTLLLLSIIIGGCRREVPEQVPERDSVASAPAPAPASPAAPVDTPRAQRPAAAPSYWTGGTQAPVSTVEKERREVLAALGDFFGIVERGSESEFRARLSARSQEFLKTYDPESTIWPIAREALGTIRDRRISFLGGTPDSAALLVSGMRPSGDTTLPGAIIISVLREDSTWKVMYPGAQPYDEHVGP